MKKRKLKYSGKKVVATFGVAASSLFMSPEIHAEVLDLTMNNGFEKCFEAFITEMGSGGTVDGSVDVDQIAGGPEFLIYNTVGIASTTFASFIRFRRVAAMGGISCMRLMSPGEILNPSSFTGDASIGGSDPRISCTFSSTYYSCGGGPFPQGIIGFCTTSGNVGWFQIAIDEYQNLVFCGGQIATAGEMLQAPGISESTTLGLDEFGGDSNFVQKFINPDLSTNPIPGTFSNSIFDVFGEVPGTVNSEFTQLTQFDGDHIPAIFFGLSDLFNNDNISGTGTIVYVFDVAGYSNLSLEVDWAALGNFESADDSIVISAQIGSGPLQNVMSVLPNEAASQEYEVSGNTFVHDDPMSVVTSNGFANLDNTFKRFSAPIAGAGSTVTITIDCQLEISSIDIILDGIEEIVAFDNLAVKGELLGDTNCDGLVNLLDVSSFIDAISNNMLDPKADVNNDGTDNLLDVEPFVELLSN